MLKACGAEPNKNIVAAASKESVKIETYVKLKFEI